MEAFGLSAGTFCIRAEAACHSAATVVHSALVLAVWANFAALVALRTASAKSGFG
jgi:hypothetical protein